MAKQALDLAASINIHKSGYNHLTKKSSHKGKTILAWEMGTDPNSHGSIFGASWGLLACFLDISFLTSHNSISICEIFQVLRFSELVTVADKKGLHVSSLYFS